MLITADVDYIMGHLRYGHYELHIVDEEELKKYKNMSEKEKEDYILENGDLIIDDYEVDDIGSISKIEEYD